MTADVKSAEVVAAVFGGVLVVKIALVLAAALMKEAKSNYSRLY